MLGFIVLKGSKATCCLDEVRMKFALSRMSGQIPVSNFDSISAISRKTPGQGAGCWHKAGERCG